MSLNKSKDKIFQRALNSLQIGYLKGALARCTEFRRRWGTGELDHVEWLTTAYSVASPVEVRHIHMARETVRRQCGGQGFLELAVLYLRSGKQDAALRLVDIALDIAAKQHGVLIATHPTSALELAEIAVGKLADRTRGITLLNLALGHRSVYVALSDVQRLGKVLSAADSPMALWADWCYIFLSHIKFATIRTQTNWELGDPQLVVDWAQKERMAIEGTLDIMLSEAPHGVKALLEKVANHLAEPGLADAIHQRFRFHEIPVPNSSVEPIWWETTCLRFRYFWYDAIDESEQAMLCNGDWAMFNTPTLDYSMALAQWWRTLESILKRGVAKELSQLFQQHPEWIEWDRENLSPKLKQKEQVFLKLADPQKAVQMTLGDLLLVLKKCFLVPENSKNNGSRLRCEAQRHLSQFQKQLSPLVTEEWLDPLLLSEENITFFRNRASHDAAISELDALVGRLIAKRLLDRFHQPVLDKWGFTAQIEHRDSGA